MRVVVDELLLMIHPVVLGSGRRLFGASDDLLRFDLVDCRPTEAGVLITTYRAATG